MNYLQRVATEIRAEVPKNALPTNDQLDLLFLFYAVLLLAKGEQVVPADVHNAWSAWMTACGKDHESLRPFWELDRPVKEEDNVFVAAIRKVAREKRIEPSVSWRRSGRSTPENPDSRPDASEP